MAIINFVTVLGATLLFMCLLPTQQAKNVCGFMLPARINTRYSNGVTTSLFSSEADPNPPPFDDEGSQTSPSLPSTLQSSSSTPVAAFDGMSCVAFKLNQLGMGRTRSSSESTQKNGESEYGTDVIAENTDTDEITDNNTGYQGKGPKRTPAMYSREWEIRSIGNQ